MPWQRGSAVSPSVGFNSSKLHKSGRQRMICRGNPVTLFPNLGHAGLPNATDAGIPGAQFGATVWTMMVSSGVPIPSPKLTAVSLLSATLKPHPWGCSLQMMLALAPCCQPSCSRFPRRPCGRWEVPVFSGYFDSIPTHLLGWPLSPTQTQCKI